MIHHSISLIYTTARPHLINTIMDRWLLKSDKDVEMIIVTDEPFANNNSDSRIRFLVNTGRRDCVKVGIWQQRIQPVKY